MDISSELKEKAISLGLCTEWTNEWNNEDKDSLCEKYIRGIDFCIEHDYPSIKYMSDNFDGVMQKHGIFVDNCIDEINLRKAVLNGISFGRIVYDKFSVGKIYLRHNSVLDLWVKDSAKVFISIYDNTILNAHCSDFSKLYVYNFGGKVNYDKSENIIIKNGNTD